MDALRTGITLGTALWAVTPAALAQSFTLTLYHTNDLHGRTDAYPSLITTLNEAKATYGDGLLLDAGDIFPARSISTSSRAKTHWPL